MVGTFRNQEPLAQSSMTEQSFDSEVYLGRKRRERILSWGSMILGALILLDSG